MDKNIENKIRCLESKEKHMMQNVINSIHIFYIGISEYSPKYRLADVTYNEDLTHSDYLMDLFAKYVEERIGYKLFFAEYGSNVYKIHNYEEYKIFSHRIQRLKNEIRSICRDE